ncbi:AzlD domain-containing protein [Glycomyces buryatensis]|uniref:AzlD domain-containing protein n=1 Tax=Glycomyces buryatensis TaxID=2570927 RepID=A0A4S8QED2_9ACTN|nr:AzlD domain-containing protein [Glycomyces buryatensis]THV39559.1 AzlD domain-containing protein [Glycomyces buryatensis]
MTAVLALAVGVFLVRLTGPVLRNRINVSERTEAMMKRGATVVLAALVITGALIADGGFAGWALPAGVLVGGLLAWRRAPILVIVVAAAATTALLRLAGIS